MKWRFCALTFNVNGRAGDRQVVRQIVKECLSRSPTKNDGFILSLQEVRPVEGTGMTEDAWKELFQEVLWTEGFITLSSSYLLTNFLIVFCLREHAPMVKKCSFEYIKDLYYGVKGSICMTVQLKNNISIVFVGSHLVHGADQFNKRVIQAKKVKDFAQQAISSQSTAGIVWLGDFNFRVSRLDSIQFVQALNNQPSGTDLSNYLREYDQLSEARYYYDIFDDWIESEVSFKPTYRLHVGTTQYDAQRVPSWTDRILFNRMECCHYDSLPSIQVSDHFPVLAVLDTHEFNEPKTRQWAITFEKIDSWYVGIPLRLSFNGAAFWKENGSVWDWVGVFKLPKMCEKRPATFVSIMSCTDSGHNYVAQFSALSEGDYVVAYHSYNLGCIQGLTDVFPVRDL